jgi:hypothetical protein
MLLGIIDETSGFWCPSTKRLLQALALQDAARLGPLRLRINIAVSLPIINMCITHAVTLFPCAVTRMYINAALYIGFALSLRPDDYLRPGSSSFHRVRPQQLAFWFDFGYVSLFDVASYPPIGTRPLRLSFLPDYDKANPLGGMVMRACAGNPNVHQPCFVMFLLEFFRRFPPVSAESSLFASIPSGIDLYACVNSLLKHVAPLLGLSPHQLLPRGLRAGATTHIRGFGGSDSDAKLTGGWRSDAFHIYQRANFASSDRCASAMHSTQADDIGMLRYIHTTAAPSR